MLAVPPLWSSVGCLRVDLHKQSSTEEPHLDHLMGATEVIDASGKAVSGNTGNEQLNIEPVPNSHNDAVKSVCDATREDAVSERGSEKTSGKTS